MIAAEDAELKVREAVGISTRAFRVSRLCSCLLLVALPLSQVAFLVSFSRRLFL